MSGRTFYMRARYYQPSTGRFISRDPAGLAGGLNAYAYCGNDPVNCTDPSGMLPSLISNGPSSYYSSMVTNWGDQSRIADSLAGDRFYGNLLSAADNVDPIEVGIAALGVIPGLNVVVGAVNVANDIDRGDYASAGLSLISMVPVLGVEGSVARTAVRTAVRTERAAIGAAESACARGMCGGLGQCFVAGTPVQTPTGLKPIEDIKEGDLVAARDEHTGNTVYEPVQRLYRNRDRVIVDVTLGDGQGREETLGTTPEHPFHLHGRGWVPAKDLAPGDQVDDLAFGTLAVKSLATRAHRQDTFNFEVKDLHSYFVGNLGAWVHNQCVGAKGAAGEFSIMNWAGYPAGVPKPQGPFRLLEGAEYDAARSAANAANSTIRREQGLVGKAVDVHEIQPVKFGGSATDPANKVVLPRDVHRQQVTPWWNQLMRDVSGQ